jgi:drug/metabolite transporter (DMT)-like permease
LIGIGLALIASAFDTSGNFLFVAATRIGRLDVAAVLSSLYPASTILLAIWLLHERTNRRQAVGMTAALVAVALIS